MEHPILTSIRRASFTPFGWFEPAVADAVPADAKFVILIGNAGPDVFRRFARERNPQTDQIDDWTRDVVGALADDLSARAVYPFDRPHFPFLTWARRAVPAMSRRLASTFTPPTGFGMPFVLPCSFRLPLICPCSRPVRIHVKPALKSLASPPAPWAHSMARPMMSPHVQATLALQRDRIAWITDAWRGAPAPSEMALRTIPIKRSSSCARLLQHVAIRLEIPPRLVILTACTKTS